MTERNEYKVIKSLNILIFILIISISCSGGQKDQAPEPVEIIEVPDSSLLFDGKTLDGWEITNFGPQGPVYVSGGEIILGMGEGCTGITYKKEFPLMEYIVTLDAKRVSGNDFFCGLTFPVGKDHCSLIVGGWGGTVVGLSSIDKMDASENETTTLQKFEKNRWYSICLMVKEDTIKALIDDDVVVDFAIGDKKLSIRPEVRLSKPFGITSWTTTAAIRNIRVTGIED